MTAPFRIAIAGLGTVGAGVIKILQNHGALITVRAGRPIEIVAVSARDRDKDRGVDLAGYEWVDDSAALAEVPAVNAVVELIGGSDGVAKELAENSLGKGVSFVTANKALLAHHGYELAQLAEDHEASLMYEAAVAGGIPIIKAIREGFAGNTIQAVYGILNGTCNYILTEMRETGRDFNDVLKEAQEKGYAEADPAFDIEGTDAAHKLAILRALCFGVRPDFDSLQVTGVTHISAQDIKFAQEFGYRIKLLGIARRMKDGIMHVVEPCFVPLDSMMAAVEDVYNGVFVEGDFVGTGLSVGRGAGEGPTASAVVSDLIDLARGLKVLPFGVSTSQMKDTDISDIQNTKSCFYMRLTVMDKPGVMADVSSVMRDHNVSMETVVQRGDESDQPVSIAMMMHESMRGDIEKAAAAVENLEAVIDAPCLLRVERF